MLLAQGGHLKTLVPFFLPKYQLGSLCHSFIHSFIQQVFIECQLNASEWCPLYLGNVVA